MRGMAARAAAVLAVVGVLAASVWAASTHAALVAHHAAVAAHPALAVSPTTAPPLPVAVAVAPLPPSAPPTAVATPRATPHVTSPPTPLRTPARHAVALPAPPAPSSTATAAPRPAGVRTVNDADCLASAVTQVTLVSNDGHTAATYPVCMVPPVPGLQWGCIQYLPDGSWTVTPASAPTMPCNATGQPGRVDPDAFT